MASGKKMPGTTAHRVIRNPSFLPAGRVLFYTNKARCPMPDGPEKLRVLIIDDAPPLIQQEVL